MSKKKLSIEEALKRLQEITTLLESGELSLDESLKLYEEGIALTASCKTLLNEAEMKIKTLSDVESEEEAEE